MAFSFVRFVHLYKKFRLPSTSLSKKWVDRLEIWQEANEFFQVSHDW